ncbi:MAG: Na(+)-translocating NADH-quinone reductase subunit A [Mangrovibacterium sp.]
MSKQYKLKRGLDIKIAGTANTGVELASETKTVALKPTDFAGLTPKLCVKAGDAVKAGSVLFFDKYHPEILFTSPVSGTIKEIVRGDRRKVLEIVVEANGLDEKISFEKHNPENMSRENLIDLLLKSGLWTFVKQRPYGCLANSTETPKHIFISGFDSNPLGVDHEFIYREELKTIQLAITALGKLTSGKIYFGLPGKTSSIFESLKNVEFNTFEGAHPAGNVGIQIHHVSPINKGERVWTLSVQALVYIGRLLATGELDMSKVVALSGSEVSSPKYYRTVHGASIASLVNGKTKKAGNERIISGTILTGTKVDASGYLGYFDQSICVIPEGDDYEFMGWAAPGAEKYSASCTFLGKLLPKKEYALNANLHGGKRAFVVSGQYEKFLPMDIHPVYLLKAILAGDLDKMEQLGLYEVIEEDLALCEYACTSKINVQDIIRKGIDNMIQELG